MKPDKKLPALERHAELAMHALATRFDPEEAGEVFFPAAASAGLRAAHGAFAIARRACSELGCEPG
ncbi:MAG TPA: hypothetical protein VNL14_08330 [Candidatus Acidoferrales bacterium]|nr:hypothetical protein [Candidatus Acidoferrales bacterium]